MEKSSLESDNTSDANRIRISFYIDKLAQVTLEGHKEKTGIPVAHMIRLAIDQYIGHEFNKATGARVRMAEVGFLVKTSDGYYGILVEPLGRGRWVVFLANGFRVVKASSEFQVLPLSDGAESSASFREILKM